MKLVRLHKDPDCGLGIVVTCGNTYETVLHGAFVESIYPGSPADLDGNIKPGDQIMSVDGNDVQNDHFLTVVDLIQCSSSPVDLVIARNKNSADLPSHLRREIIEKPFTKSKAWIVGDDKHKDSMHDHLKSENNAHTSTPIPKPRKKWAEKDKPKEQLNFDAPDLTINYSTNSTVEKSWETEEECNIINKHYTTENCNIPDIIASQIKHIVSSENLDPPFKLNRNTEENGDSLSFIPHGDNLLLPGEVYHVVLEKKGGSLGLKIYQGTEPNCAEQRHIYIHSLIPNGAAELDGRIKPGDKLLEVNGVLLENLSYQEVVGKLRESSHVAHLVLEKGNLIETEGDNEILNCEVGPISENQTSKNDIGHSSIQNSSAQSNSTSFSEYISQSVEKESERKLSVVSNDDGSYNIPNIEYDNYKLNDQNSFSSLPTSVNAPELTFQSAKETNSAPSSYQHNDCKIRNLKLNECPSDISLSEETDSFSSSPPYAKAHNQNAGNFQFKNSASCKSTPNLAENSDEEDKNSSHLYRNRSTDCLLFPLHSNQPHQALFDLYQNYAFIRGSSSNIHQIPAVPIRKKKLKKLEDIYNYCNSENTFLVEIRKSSRGLGLSILGGRDTSRKDPFSQLIQIRKLYPLQPALECGQLALGDVILEVNGTSMIGLTNTEALEVLRSAPQEVILKIFRPSKSLIPSFSVFKGVTWPFCDSSSSSACSSLSRIENNTYNVETGEFEVTLIKRGGSLGFTISRKEVCSESMPEGIYIKALVREPAVSDGRIQPGDRILQVNGTIVSSMSHAEAIEFIRNSPDTVTLKLFRDDPPLTPANLEDDFTISKPLRWEAMELLNDRVKHKDVTEDSTLKRKIKRKLDRTSNAPSNSSTESESSTSSSGQEHIIDESDELCGMAENLGLENVGLQRNQRPKSLDVLNSSDRKRLTGFSQEDSFHRQSSVMCPNIDLKNESNENSNSAAKKGKNLLKWRGSTLPDSEESSSPDIANEKFVIPSNYNSNKEDEKLLQHNEVDEEDYKPVPFPRTTSFANEWVHTFDVDLDRGWHGRLGFSLCDPKSDAADSSRNMLPTAAEVKAVYPGSLADKDGRIKVGDRLVEVNRECLLNKSATEVIDILRKTRGVIRMVFCRLEKRS